MTNLLNLTQPDPVEWCESNIQLDFYLLNIIL